MPFQGTYRNPVPVGTCLAFLRVPRSCAGQPVVEGKTLNRYPGLPGQGMIKLR